MLQLAARLANVACTRRAIKGVARAPRALLWCYTAMMWTFTSGFVILTSVLIINVAGAHKPKNGAGLFVPGEPLPPFDPASATDSDDRLAQAVCAARKVLEDSGSLSALVVGRYDRRELSTRAVARVGTNLELAHRR